MALTKNSLSVLFMAFFLMAVVSEFAEASSLTVYGGPGCAGRRIRLDGCGCSNIDFRNGYVFVYTGPTANMYNQADCQGVSNFAFNANATRCTSFGWRSTFIQC
ncbi:hypothetical protein MKX01_006365 [Papaver californicum]|nr:hypothetical protein MKX01_006365 [Papaver californicum]